MADVLLNSITGGGGDLVLISFTGGLSLSSGATGDVIIITPPAGKRAVLLGLQAATSNEVFMTITVGSKTVITSISLAATNSGTGLFSVGTMNPSSNSPGNLHMIIGNKDEAITISKDSGPTIGAIEYSTGIAE